MTYIADGAKLLDSEGHIRYPDNEDYQVGTDGVSIHSLRILGREILHSGIIYSFKSNSAVRFELSSEYLVWASSTLLLMVIITRSTYC